MKKLAADKQSANPPSAEAEEWLSVNRKAIDAYNARVQRDGAWSEKLRGF